MYSHTSTIVAFIAFIKFFKFYHLFTSLKILKILNDLKALIAPKLPWTELISPIIKSIIEITTISASKTLKGFDKKFINPNPISYISSSNANIKVNMKFIYYNISDSL